MNLGAAVGAFMDRRERMDVNAQLRTPSCGFRQIEDTQLWRFALYPLLEELAAPQGPAVQLCLILGMPFARLRSALDDAMFSSDLAAALGKRHGFSAAGLNASSALHSDLLRKKGSSKKQLAAQLAARTSEADAEADASSAGMPPHPDASDAAAAAAAALPSPRLSVPRRVSVAAEAHFAKYEENARTTHEEFIGTALVLAFLQVASLAPVGELGARRSAASKHFGDLTTPAGWTFDETTTSFVTLLSPGILNTKMWWNKARRAAASRVPMCACRRHATALLRQLTRTRSRLHPAGAPVEAHS